MNNLNIWRTNSTRRTRNTSIFWYFCTDRAFIQALIIIGIFFLICAFILSYTEFVSILSNHNQISSWTLNTNSLKYHFAMIIASKLFLSCGNRAFFNTHILVRQKQGSRPLFITRSALCNIWTKARWAASGTFL